MQTPYLEGPGGLPLAELTPINQPIHVKHQFAFDNGFSSGGIAQGNPNTSVTNGNVPPVLTAAATIAFTPTAAVTQLTPAQAETINFSAPGAYGTEICLEIITSGVTSYTLTFGTNTKSQGTLATGTVSGKTFLVCFVSDGTNWVEQSRTSAM